MLGDHIGPTGIRGVVELVDVIDRVPTDVLRRLAAVRDTLELSLPGRVRKVILFGSMARDDAGPESDLDLAVLIRREAASDASVRDAVADAVLPHLMDGFCFSALSLDDNYLDRVDGHYRTELARRIAAEGIEV